MRGRVETGRGRWDEVGQHVFFSSFQMRYFSIEVGVVLKWNCFQMILLEETLQMNKLGQYLNIACWILKCKNHLLYWCHHHDRHLMIIIFIVIILFVIREFTMRDWGSQHPSLGSGGEWDLRSGRDWGQVKVTFWLEMAVTLINKPFQRWTTKSVTMEMRRKRKVGNIAFHRCRHHHHYHHHYHHHHHHHYHHHHHQISHPTLIIKVEGFAVAPSCLV